MTKICDFPLVPCLWPDQKFEILFKTVVAGTVALNRITIIFKGSLWWIYQW